MARIWLRFGSISNIAVALTQATRVHSIIHRGPISRAIALACHTLTHTVCATLESKSS